MYIAVYLSDTSAIWEFTLCNVHSNDYSVYAQDWCSSGQQVSATLVSVQPWMTPTTKFWPGSARADEIHGDRNVVATRNDKLVESKKMKKS